MLWQLLVHVLHKPVFKGILDERTPSDQNRVLLPHVKKATMEAYPFMCYIEVPSEDRFHCIVLWLGNVVVSTCIVLWPVHIYCCIRLKLWACLRT